MELTGSQIIMEVFKEEGVDTIFGFPGGMVIDLYDELSRATKSDISLFVTSKAPFMLQTVMPVPRGRPASV